MIKKRAFTLIEIIIALIISAIIGVYIFKQRSYTNFKESVEEFGKQVVKIISVGVMNNTVGYANGSGGPCSDNKDYFDDITASRVLECVGWTNKFDNHTDYFDGVKLLGAYSSDGKGCKLYFDSTGSNTTKFKLFVDCSNITFGNDKKYKKYVENRLEYILKSSNEVADSIADVNHTATSLSADGGSDDDGKVLFDFDSSLH